MRPLPSVAAFEVVHARMLRFFPELVRDLGGDPMRLMGEVGIDPSQQGKSGSFSVPRSSILEQPLQRTRRMAPWISSTLWLPAA